MYGVIGVADLNDTCNFKLICYTINDLHRKIVKKQKFNGGMERAVEEEARENNFLVYFKKLAQRPTKRTPSFMH